MPYFTYILYSESLDRYYVGSSQDLQERLRRHRSNHKGYTGKADDWAIAYFETFDEKADATARERTIKRWKSRKMIEQLIRQQQEEE